jgi:ABC-type spermidine/putrescine transport system permease subunit II
MIGASFLILLTSIGFKLGFASVLMAHIAFSIPIVVLMVLPRLQEMDQDMINAAYDLGATTPNDDRSHLAVFDTRHYRWLFHGLYLFFG